MLLNDLIARLEAAYERCGNVPVVVETGEGDAVQLQSGSVVVDAECLVLDLTVA